MLTVVVFPRFKRGNEGVPTMVVVGTVDQLFSISRMMIRLLESLSTSFHISEHVP